MDETTTIPDELVYVAFDGHLRIARDGHMTKDGEWKWHYFNSVHSSNCRCVTNPESWF